MVKKKRSLLEKHSKVKLLNLKQQVKIVKNNGFRFKYVFKNGRKYCVRFDLPAVNDYHYSITLGKDTYSKDSLVDALDALKVKYLISIHTAQVNHVNARARRLRRSFKVISGGMMWVPNGLSYSQPSGKLTLVKAA